MKNYVRVKRGMVFWFNTDKVYNDVQEYVGYDYKTYKSNVQRGNRHWLVTSNDDANSSSTTCNIVPITTEEKAAIPVHVNFNFEGKRQTILCEQPRTVDIRALGNYICTLSDEVMEKVERAIAIQHNIRPKILHNDWNLDNVVKNLENIVSKIIDSKLNQIDTPKNNTIPINQIEDAAIKLGQMIEDLVVVPNSESHKTDKEVIRVTPDIESYVVENSDDIVKPIKNENSQIEKFNKKLQKFKKLQESKQPVNSTIDNTSNNKMQSTNSNKENRKKNVWTAESRKAFLKDCEELSPQEVMKKYNFSNVQCVFQTKYQCKNILEGIDKKTV